MKLATDSRGRVQRVAGLLLAAGMAASPVAPAHVASAAECDRMSSSLLDAVRKEQWDAATREFDTKTPVHFAGGSELDALVACDSAGKVAGFRLVPHAVPEKTVGPNKPFRDLAAGLASRGVAVMRYDKRTRAHPELFAGGDYTLADEALDDAHAALALMRTQSQVDPARVFLLGHSMGASLAPFIARSEAMKGVILAAAPARPPVQMVRAQMTYLFNLDGMDGPLRLRPPVHVQAVSGAQSPAHARRRTQHACRIREGRARERGRGRRHRALDRGALRDRWRAVSLAAGKASRTRTAAPPWPIAPRHVDASR